MNPLYILIILLLMTSAGYYLGRKRALVFTDKTGGPKTLHSRPVYYGTLTALWCAVPSLFIFSFWMMCESTVITDMVISKLPESVQTLPSDRLNLVMNDVRNLVDKNMVSGEESADLRTAADYYLHLRSVSRGALFVLIMAAGIAGISILRHRIRPELRARNHVERVIYYVLIACSILAIFTTIGIVLSVLYESIRFFKIIPIQEFLFGLEWSPQMAIRTDQVGSSGAFGAIPVFTGTLLVSAIAMAVAVPVGLMSAIYLSEYANKKFRAFAKPLLEILAGIPTVVYGFFAALVVAPVIRDTGALINLDISSESALAAGLVMGVMIIPFVSSLADDVINAVPQGLRDGALSLGSTQSETIRHIVVPAALPGIVGGVLLAVSRAIGETMIVVMAAGLSANMTLNPLKTVTTVTVQIVTLLVGDQEFDSPKTLAAFALGLLLFVVTLILNIIALYVVKKYREQYE